MVNSQNILTLWGNQPSGFPNGESTVFYRSINFQQGQYGDCQTLTAMFSIDALKDGPGNQHEYGEAFLNKMVTKNPDGSYDVKFAGYDKPLHITPGDLADQRLARITESTNLTIDPKLAQVIEAAYLKVHANENSVVNPFELFLGKEAKVYGIPASEFQGDFMQTLLKQGNGGRDLVMLAP